MNKKRSIKETRARKDFSFQTFCPVANSCCQESCICLKSEEVLESLTPRSTIVMVNCTNVSMVGGGYGR